MPAILFLHEWREFSRAGPAPTKDQRLPGFLQAGTTPPVYLVFSNSRFYFSSGINRTSLVWQKLNMQADMLPSVENKMQCRSKTAGHAVLERRK